MFDEKFMKIAINEAKKAYKKQEIPIGCVIVKNNKIISKAHNKKEKTKQVTAHAEILAINKACKKIKSWHLNDCILYTTLEPCMMCTGAIIQSRIKKIYYATKSEKFGMLESLNNNEYNLNICSGVLEKESKELLKKFFDKRRK
ncbi:MAG: nucleoside deaminase [Bacilli bacterium]|nr:nucleoside deaminase [Bacilli bacterium]